MESAGQLRQNVLTGHWIAVAPDRGARPVEVEPAGPAVGLPERDGDCPFCPGNEDDLPGVLLEHGGRDGRPWDVRVVPNRYPAFTNDASRGEWVEASLAGAGSGIGRSLTLGSDVPVQIAEPLPAVGYQEVIIESPRHDHDPASMDGDHLRAALDVYHQRYLAVSESIPNCRIFVFRNRGQAAGNSLVHPHAQLIATNVIPPEVRVREIRMLGYQGDHGQCMVCGLSELEPRWEERLVAENDHFVAMVPWAASTPFETWIVPREHQSEFGQLEPEQRVSLARILQQVLVAYRDRAGDPPYNLMVHSPRRSRSGSRAFHWFAQLRPRSSQLAGFELASGITINSSLPERDARVLRGEDAGTDGA